MKNTEKHRKSKLSQQQAEYFEDYIYDDDNPPTDLPTDGAGQLDEDNPGNKKLTCPHYRQLTSLRTATLAQAELVPSQASVNCCSVGGEKTKLGAIDIEDLISFGMNPYVHRTAIYRDGSTNSFGISLSAKENGCIVDKVKEGSAAAKEGTLKRGDRILKVNGRGMQALGLDAVANACRSSENPLEIEVLRDEGPGKESGSESYSQHSACPYYLSRALSKHAEIVFSPYNYLLDPSIRDAMGLDLSEAVIVLDEAHNVEDTLRESGSGKFGELELCELMVMLEYQSRKGSLRRNRDGEVDVGAVAHELLLFMEPIVGFMRESRERFEKDPGAYDSFLMVGYL